MRVVVAPACAAHASAHGLVYRGVTVHGPRNDEPRQQRTWFDSDSQARDAYFARLESLSSDGFIDADSQVG